MPTVIDREIGATGYYSTVQAWEDDMPASLVAADEQWIGRLQNQVFSVAGTVLTVSGHSSDATRYAKLTTKAAASFADDDTNEIAYNEANGACLKSTSGSYGTAVSISDPYFQLEKVMVMNSVASSSAVQVAAANCKISSCVLQGVVNSGSSGVLHFNGSADNSLAVNSAIYLTGNSLSGYGVRLAEYAYGIELVNLTVVSDNADGLDATKGIFALYSHPKTSNCAFYGFADSYVISGSGWPAGSVNNSTDDTIVPGTGLTSQAYTATAPFVDASGSVYDLKSVASSELDAGGSQDAATSDLDIFGNARDVSTPWIGCYEPAAGGGGWSIANVDLDNDITDGQTGVVIAITGAVSATGKKVWLEQSDNWVEQTVTAEDTTSATITVDFGGTLTAGAANLYLRDPL